MNDTPEPGTPLNAPEPTPIAPIEDHLTLHPDGETQPTAGDGRPDGFLVGDQTAAGALTPPGGRHPGEPAGIPGTSGNLLDPYRVNGAQANQEILANGDGVENPDVHKDTGDHKPGDDSENVHKDD